MRRWSTLWILFEMGRRDEWGIGDIEGLGDGWVLEGTVAIGFGKFCY